MRTAGSAAGRAQWGRHIWFQEGATATRGLECDGPGLSRLAQEIMTYDLSPVRPLEGWAWPLTSLSLGGLRRPLRQLP